MNPRVRGGLLVLGYVAMGALTAQITTAVVGPAAAIPRKGLSAKTNTAYRSVCVGAAWPIALPVVLFIAAGKPDA